MPDLSDFTPKTDTIDVVIKHPKTKEPIKNDDGSNMVITRYLPHTKEYKASRHKQADLVLKKNTEELTSAEYEQLGLDFLAETTADWDITYEGKKPKFSVKKAKEIYDRLAWIGVQLREAEQEATDFT